MRPPRFRTKDFSTCLGSTTARGLESCWPKRMNQYCLLISERDRHLEVRPISQLNTQPVVSPVNASRVPSRVPAHHSGPRRWARPYLVEDFHLLSFAGLSWRTRFWVGGDRPFVSFIARKGSLNSDSRKRPVVSELNPTQKA